jgi:hypothetical protein
MKDHRIRANTNDLHSAEWTRIIGNDTILTWCGNIETNLNIKIAPTSAGNMGGVVRGRTQTVFKQNIR